MKWLVLVTLSSSACTALADFPEDRLTEATDVLCRNGVDDDADGLTDCHDWKCHPLAVCCDVPSVVLEDAFEGDTCTTAACDADDRGCEPDPDRWTRWGAPYPYLCEDALTIGKDFASCYPVGVLSRATMALAPGLRVDARVSGRPEVAGVLTVGWTGQSAVIDGSEPCAPLAPVPTMASISVAGDEPGRLRFIAAIEDVAFADVIFDERPYRMSVAVDDDRQLVFAVDDTVFATYALAGDLGFDVRLVASGRGSTARLDHVRVVAGTRCESPDTWELAATATPLGAAVPSAWDGFEQRSPNASLDDTGRFHLRYIGCTADAVNPICGQQSYAIGDAIASAGAAFDRPDTASLQTAQIVAEGSIGLDFFVDEDAQLAYFGVDVDEGDLGVRIDGATAAGEDVTTLLALQDGWDEAAVCCPSVVSRGDDTLLYYGGRADGETGWRIGLAISTDGGPFVRVPSPVLDVGEPGDFDDRSVSQPWVIRDEPSGLYRMWYTATGELGRTSIGYAVSVDGERWQKFPGGAVATPDDIGGITIGSPTVIDDGGRLRMWVDGLAPGAVAKTIYELENVGVEPP